jgi:hypothetical protein
MSPVSEAVRGHTPFAIWNRSGNRLIVLILRSPLHAVFSSRLALITVTGRRSGSEHTLPIMYKREGSTLTIPVMWPERKLWWRNLRGGAPVRLRLRGKNVSGRGEIQVLESGETTVEVELASNA